MVIIKLINYYLKSNAIFYTNHIIRLNCACRIVLEISSEYKFATSSLEEMSVHFDNVYLSAVNECNVKM